jgi:glyoxylase-like metal-dependent hydrolase (beta-lactamase superfamily II)
MGKTQNQNTNSKLIAPGIYQISIPTPFAVGPVNVYLIEGDYLTLVDAGPKSPEAWEALETGIQNCGYEISDIKQIVLTHHHLDHSGLLERVRQSSNAIIMAHPLSVPYVELDKNFLDFHHDFFHQLYKESGVPDEGLRIVEKHHNKMGVFSEQSQIDLLLKHEQKVPNLPEWEVWYTPGHSQSHISLYRASDRILIGADHIIKHISSNALIEPPMNNATNRPLTLVQYRTSLEMCASRDIDFILPGHGEVVYNHRELITYRLKRNWDRSNDLRQFLRDGKKTAYELTTLLFPEVYRKELPLTFSETLGHLDLLSIVGQVEHTTKDGIIYYSL